MHPHLLNLLMFLMIHFVLQPLSIVIPVDLGGLALKEVSTRQLFKSHHHVLHMEGLHKEVNLFTKE